MDKEILFQLKRKYLLQIHATLHVFLKQLALDKERYLGNPEKLVLLKQKLEIHEKKSSMIP